MTETTALLPCPFCGFDDPLVLDIEPHKHAVAGLPDHPGSATVECHACAIGLIKPTRAEAISAWNRRATPPALPAAPVAEGWRPMPAEPTTDMLKPLDRFMRPEAARELLKEVFAAAPPAPGAAPASDRQAEALTEAQIDRGVRALMTHKFGEEAALMFDIPSNAPEHVRARIAERLDAAKREVTVVAAALAAARTKEG